MVYFYAETFFHIFVQKANEVLVNKSVPHSLMSIYQGQKSMTISLYQTSEVSPVYTADKGVVKGGDFVLDISDGLALDKGRRVTITMHFGRSSIQVFAAPTNFGSRKGTYMLPIVLDTGTT